MPTTDNNRLTFVNARVYDGHALLPGLIYPKILLQLGREGPGIANNPRSQAV